MSLSLHSGMTFLSQVRPVGVKGKVTNSRQRQPGEKLLTKDDSPGSSKSLEIIQNELLGKVEKFSDASKTR